MTPSRSKLLVLVGSLVAIVLILALAPCVVWNFCNSGIGWPLRAALFLGMSPNASCKEATLLHAAVGTNDIELVKYLLARGADVNGRSRFSATPLMVAAGLGKPEMIRVLLAAGADVKASSINPRRLLLEAPVHNGYTAVVKQLIDAGAEIDRGSPALLIESARENHVETMAVLLDAGADPNAGPANGPTPLMFAAAFADISGVRLLLEHGANMEARDSAGERAVDWARSQGRVGTAHLLEVRDSPVR